MLTDGAATLDDLITSVHGKVGFVLCPLLPLSSTSTSIHPLRTTTAVCLG